eukprot:11191635-Lingulodinium_polyedra.AAC.1
MRCSGYGSGGQPQRAAAPTCASHATSGSSCVTMPCRCGGCWTPRRRAPCCWSSVGHRARTSRLPDPAKGGRCSLGRS